jgi:dihydrofolate reductase
MVKLIVCVDLMGNIGRNNDLLFHIKEDMKFFREKTSNSIVVMGYNTWLSLNEKELPNRKNIVLTNENIPNVTTYNDIFKVINEYKEEDMYIIGGAYVYNESLRLGLVDEILITIVPTVIEGADATVDLGLMQEYKKQKKIKEFTYKEMKVSIWSWKK